MAVGDAVDVDEITAAILESWERSDLRTNTLSSPTRGPQVDEDEARAHRAIEVMVGKFRAVADSIRAGSSTRERAIELAVEIAGQGTTPDDVLDAAERFAVWIATGSLEVDHDDDGDELDDEREDAEPLP
jgi:hypothetical protein